MKYQVKISRAAMKFIGKQPQNQRERILKAIYHLPDGDSRPLQGNPGLFRLRVGDYRVIYTIDHGQLIVYVIDAGNRGQIYSRY